MSHKTVTPVVTKADDPIGGEVHTHPAYGVIRLTQTHGGGVRFGSDVPQMASMRIEVKAAHLRRTLSRDVIVSDETIVRLDMTHSQWAQFITSVGHGEGMPCTLSYRESVGGLPGIENIQSKNETLRQEIQDAARQRVKSAMEALAALRDLVDDGKTGKTALRPAIQEAIRHMEQLPSHLGFVLSQAEEALEHATSDAKIEVESYIALTANRLGLKNIQELKAIGSDVSKNDGDQSAS